MKKTIESSKKLVLFLFLSACLFSCVCPCYLEQTFTNVNDVRTKVTALIDTSADSIQNHTLQIAETNKVVDYAISTNMSRKGCKDVGKLWSLIKNDSTGLYDRFLTDWKKFSVLPKVIRVDKKENINKLLDEIVSVENAIKKNHKPCINTKK